MNQLSDLETKDLIRLLSKVEPGYYPIELFIQLSRLTVSIAVEIVPIRQKANNIEVLFTLREQNDPIWPGLYHTPGSILRPNDEKFSLKSAFNRVFKEEIGIEYEKKPKYVGNYFYNTSRGSSFSLVYWISIKDSTKGNFFNYSKIPKNVIEEQLLIIDMAVEDYKERKRL